MKNRHRKGTEEESVRTKADGTADKGKAKRVHGRVPKKRGDERVADVPADELKPGDRIVVTIRRIGINGEGVGYYKRKAVFVPGALPGEVVKAAVARTEPNRLTADLVEIEKRSPHRVKPPCPVYERCGGCQLQHMDYAGQLKAKEELVREAFARYAGLEGDPLPLRPIIGMDEPWRYRNKAQLQAGRTPDGKLALGLYEPGSHRLVDIAGCAVQHPAVTEAAGRIRRLIGEARVPVGSGPEGALRTVVLRVAPESGKLQLVLVASAGRFPGLDRLVSSIRRELPQITSISVNVNRGSSPLVFGEQTRLLWGEPALETKLGELSFRLSPRAFFQLNPEQTVKLYDLVREAAALTGQETVVDAYCGTGTIALWLAPHAREVRGIETIREAVDDAERNARLNGRTNARFYVGRAEELLPRWLKTGFRPDVIVVDPPRTGCDDALLRAVADVKPPRFVYVSCNPATLAKDCRFLLDSGFRIEWVQPVDMFPQTSHVESVLLLVRNE
ncbi:23S rRNA (uracil(1939)-C(5))-methyltransferase RlmD [Thermobacillus sp. ZCTH02-B1]|uniref:23S rRNA (uracil(1939)-C(5))-methyltransferase RlmD n=1 Tax=Thermobacillus sp. ZCTH02-B1 TaxID=1858795 RepID=UPI0025D8D0FC|nr:23S rRNA (uracil(1939)-C(5))-methyltransferase RlmD [Thermobacillus sp. ZCTH02-B1]